MLVSLAARIRVFSLSGPCRIWSLTQFRIFVTFRLLGSDGMEGCGCVCLQLLVYSSPMASLDELWSRFSLIEEEEGV